MKVLYAIQGTGNGHLCRAMDVVPCLQEVAQVDILLSGTQADIHLPFDVKFRYKGLSFIFGKSGGVDLWKTFVNSRFRSFIKEVNACPVNEYDLVINDFEPVSAWACNLKDIPYINLSHQAAAIHSQAPKPEEADRVGKFILEHYAPSNKSYGFHFKSYSPNFYTPVIRKQVREQAVSNDGHYTVYLPSYDDHLLISYLSRFPEVRWDVYSKHNKGVIIEGNVKVQPIDNENFIKSMATCEGMLCGAGFETPAEALFLKKKLLVIPMKNQYEQHLNAAALEQLGVPVIKNIKPENDVKIRDWINTKQVVNVKYENQIKEIVDKIMNDYRSSLSL